MGEAGYVTCLYVHIVHMNTISHSSPNPLNLVDMPEFYFDTPLLTEFTHNYVYPETI